MDVLREKSLSTQMLILLEIVTGHHSRLAPIADKVGITKQAVSDYLKKMREDDLVTVVNSEYRATMQGTQLLHTQLLELKQFLESNLEKMDIIHQEVALAKSPIQKGETVGLFMERGTLIARSGEPSSSTGIAGHQAAPGEEVSIHHLQGMVDLAMGTLYILELPGPHQGGSRTIATTELCTLLDRLSPDLIAVGGVVAKAALHKIDREYHLEFAVAPAALEAVQRGLTVALLGCSTETGPVLSALEEYNSSSPTRIPYQLIPIPPKTIKKK